MGSRARSYSGLVVLVLLVVLGLDVLCAPGVRAEPPAGSTIEGRVLDEEGRPLAGVRVEAIPVRAAASTWPFLEPGVRTPFDLLFGSGEALDVPPVVVATTDVSGRFVLRPTDAAEGYTVRARPEGIRWGTWASVGPGGQHPVDRVLRVRPGRFVKGRLVDDAGAPLVGRISAFEVHATAIHDGPLVDLDPYGVPDLPTDAEGRFEFVAPLGSQVRLNVVVPGVAQQSGAHVPADAGEVVVVVARSGGASVEGHVRDLAGNPLPGARVLLQTRGTRLTGWQEQRTTAAVTDADGAFRVAGLPATVLAAVAADAEGYAVWAQAGVEAPLLPGRPLSLDLALARPSRVRVRLHDGEGLPVSGARVLAGPGSGSTTVLWSREATSDAEGMAELTDVPPGRGYLVVASATHHAAEAEPSAGGLGAVPFTVAGDGTVVEAAVRLARSRILRGRVVTPEGSPVADALLRCSYERSDAPRRSGSVMATVHTDATGAFELAVAPCLWVDVAVEPKDGPPFPARIDIGAPGDTTPTLVAPRPARLAGVVLDEHGRPASGVAVTCGTQRDATDDAGRFAFTVAPGRTFVGVGTWPQHRVTVAPGPGEEILDLVLRRQGEAVLAGLVVDASGDAVPGIQVQVQMKGVPAIGRHTMTGSDGSFRFERFPVGTYFLSTEGVRTEVTTGTEEALGLRVALPAPGPSFVLDGIVLDPEGRPVGGPLGVREAKDGGHTTRVWAASVQGRFRVRVPGPSRDVVLVVAEALDPTRRRLNVLPVSTPVAAGVGDPVVVRLPLAQRLLGRVLDEDGRPVAGIGVSATPERPPEAGTWRSPEEFFTGDDGSFDIPGLEPTPHFMFIRARSPWLQVPRVSATPGGEPLAIRLVRARSLTVAVFGPSGAPLPGCPVSTQVVGSARPNPGRASATGPTDAEGRFLHDQLPPGEKVVVVVQPPETPEAADLLGERREVSSDDGVAEVSLTEGLCVAGRVTDLEGRPVAGAQVSVSTPGEESPRPAGRAERTVTTDAEGRFVMRRFAPAARVRVTVEPPKTSPPVWFGVLRSDLTVGPETADLVFRLERPVAIEGAVSGVEAASLAGFRLDAHSLVRGSPSASFRFDGTSTSFRIDGLKPGTHRLLLQGGRGDLEYDRERLVEAPTAGLELGVRRLYRASGVLLGAGGESFEVTLYGPEGQVGRTSSGPDGLFSIGRLSHRVVTLVVQRNGDPRVAMLTDLALDGTEPLVVELGRGRPISGRIADEARNLEGKVRACRGTVCIEGVVREDGTFETPTLPEGAWRLEFEFRYPIRGTLDVPASVEAGTKDLVLRPKSPPPR